MNQHERDQTIQTLIVEGKTAAVKLEHERADRLRDKQAAVSAATVTEVEAGQIPPCETELFFRRVVDDMQAADEWLTNATIAKAHGLAATIVHGYVAARARHKHRETMAAAAATQPLREGMRDKWRYADDVMIVAREYMAGVSVGGKVMVLKGLVGFVTPTEATAIRAVLAESKVPPSLVIIDERSAPDGEAVMRAAGLHPSFTEQFLGSLTCVRTLCLWGLASGAGVGGLVLHHEPDEPGGLTPFARSCFAAARRLGGMADALNFWRENLPQPQPEVAPVMTTSELSAPVTMPRARLRPEEVNAIRGLVSQAEEQAGEENTTNEEA